MNGVMHYRFFPVESSSGLIWRVGGIDRRTKLGRYFECTLQK